MSMVEQVAKAIYEKRNGAGCVWWVRLPNSHKDPYRADARAAIEAMRDSNLDDDFMEMVAERAYDARFSKSGETYPVQRPILRAFFDAALSEEG